MVNPKPVRTPSILREPLFWLTLLLTVFAVAPFALPGYFWTANDARHHVYFLFEYDRAVQDGIWWPRWCPDFTFGYGYPFFNIYAPFSHFLAELFLHYVHVSHTDAIEIVFGLSIVGGAAGMYLFVRSWLGARSAMISALVYTYLPYHLLNLYVRANLAESMAFVWLPLCLWGMRQCVVRVSESERPLAPPRLWSALLLTALCYAGLMFTSNLVATLFTPFLALYTLTLVAVRWRLVEQGKRWLRRLLLLFTPGGAFLAGLGLSAYFWIPAFAERQYVRIDQWFGGRYDYRDHFVYWQQLFSPTWGFGVSQVGPNDPISFQIGVAAVALASMGVVITWRTARRWRWEIVCLIAGVLFSIGAGLTIAAPLWQMPLVGAILSSAQFPWRWQILMAPCLSALAGLAVMNVPDAKSPPPARQGQTLTPLLLGFVVLILLASYSYLQVQISPPAEGAVNLASMMRFQRNSDEMTGATAWVKTIPRWSPIAEYYVTERDEQGLPVTPIQSTLDYGLFDYQTLAAHSYTETKTTISEQVWFFNQRRAGEPLVFNHFYYPGWRAWLLDGEHGAPVRELPIVPTSEEVSGRISVPLPLGDGYLLLRFEETPVRIAGKWVSLGTIMLLVVLSGFFLTKRRHINP